MNAIRVLAASCVGLFLAWSVPEASARVLYQWTGVCDTRLFVTEEDEVLDFECPFTVRGVLTLPDDYIPGEPFSIDLSDQQIFKIYDHLAIPARSHEFGPQPATVMSGQMPEDSGFGELHYSNSVSVVNISGGGFWHLFK